MSRTDPLTDLSTQTRCDEQKPSCGLCTRAGAECPGYGQQWRWSTKYEVFQQNGQRKARQKTSNKSRSDGEDQSTSTGSPTEYQRVSDDVSNEHHDQNVVLGDTHAQDEGSHQSQTKTVVSDAALMGNILSEDPGLTNYSDLSDLFENSPPFDDLSAAFSIPGMAAEPLILGEDQVRCDQFQGDTRDHAMIPVSRTKDRSNSFALSDTSSHQPQAMVVDNMTLQLGPLVPRSEVVNLRLPAPTKPLNDPASILVEFYFKETAQFFSCYDSSMNPFRTTVSRLWNSSPLLYRTLQSMAAASLVEDFPQLAIVGRQLRNEAIEILDKNGGTTSDTLLAMLMLGGSASWHDSRDLGLTFFNRIRRKLISLGSGKMGESATMDIDYQFFHQSMTYWEMLLSYVAENDELDCLDKASPSVGEHMQDYMSLDFVPHPWTGFARDAQNAVQKVGRLLRRQRKLAFSRRFTSLAHIKQLEKDMATASELEEFLSNMCHPLEATVLDPEDKNTPVWQLLTLAEAYRSVGLIQIYHIFPDILDRRLAREGIFNPKACHNDNNNSHDDDGAPKNGRTPEKQQRNDWLTAYAVQVLNLMKSIPLESGTRDFQPFILVSLSSELRLAPHPPPQTDASETGLANHMAGINSQTIEISRMRHFIKSRLNSFLHILPPKPIRVCLDIVSTTWEQMDQRATAAAKAEQSRGGSCEEAEDVYWMDVMIENGWETTMA